MTGDRTPAAATVTSQEPVQPSDVARLAGGSAALLLIRRVVITGVGALTTAIVARRLGIVRFGELASAQGLLALLQTIVDFGFSLVVARELARNARRGALLGAAMLAEGFFGVVSMAAMAGVGLATGGGERGTIILILAPSLGIAALAPMRQVFLVSYRIRDLAKIDLATNLLQSALTVAAAFAGAGVFAVAAVFTAGQVVNPLLLARAARRRTTVRAPSRTEVRGMLRAALPLGLASILATVYFTIDLVILPWLVSRHAVGEYAAAVKFLNLLSTVPVLVMTAVLPAMSSLRDERAQLSLLAARVTHWLAVLALPACVGAIVFARTIVILFFGHAYSGSAPLLRVLAIAGALTVVSNVLGTLLTSQAVVRPQLIQNALAMTVNIGGNLALAPRFGPMASAWLSVLTEVIVDLGSLVALRGRVDLRPALAAAGRPALASGVLAAIGLGLGHWQAAAVPAAVGGFLITVLLLRAWPAELLPRWLGRFGAEGA